MRNGVKVTLKVLRLLYEQLTNKLQGDCASTPASTHTPEFIFFTKKTYPDAVFLPVLFPVPSTVAEHQEIAGHPVGAPISTLGGHGCDLHPLSKVNLQPLVFVGHKGRPATGSFCKNRRILGKNALKFKTMEWKCW